MKEQPYLKEFARYVTLSVLGMLGVSCYILVDTFFVSKGLGSNGLAALNLAIPVYNFTHGSGLMIGMGGATKFSICKGQDNRREMDVVYTNAIYLAMFFSIVFVVAGLFFSRPLALLLGADADILSMTDIYVKGLLLFAPAFVWNDVLLCFVRNDDGPRIAMVGMLLGSFVNIILDYIFIFPMQMGMFGAVFASGVSQLVSVAMMMPHWMGRKRKFHLVHTKLQVDLVRQNLALGFPSLIAQLSTGVAMIVFNMLILGLEGNVGVAAYGVVANISLVVVAVYTGIAQGAQPLFSDFYGKNDHKNMEKMLRYAMVVMVVLSAVFYLAIFADAKQIAGVFNSENNMRLQKIAVTGLKLYFTSNIFVGFNIILATFFTSTERTIPAHVLSLLRGLVLLVPMAFFLAEAGGMSGIWLTYPATEFVVAVLGAIVYRRIAGRKAEQR